MPDKDLLEFRDALFADPALQRMLLNIEDKALFIESVIAEASKMGLKVTAEAVSSAMDTGNRKWIERWI